LFGANEGEEMIGISKLYVGTVEASDPLRYGRMSGRLPSHLLQFSKDKKPVVVWNVTSRCNLKCEHCYAAVTGPQSELGTAQAMAVVDDLAAFHCPVVLFSGGEPFTRPDVLDLAAHAVEKGLRVVFSTNGTLITEAIAERVKAIGASYVGISLDGMQAVHDRFRRTPGAFEGALRGVRICRDAGIKVGLRVTMTRENVGEIPAIFDLMEREKVPRICLYHLVYSGRGAEIANLDLPPDLRRKTVDLIIDRTVRLHKLGFQTEVLTVDNHADGPYLYLRMLREKSPRAADVLSLLEMNGGNSTGLGIGCISWDGTVYPDQFWRDRPLGNVLETPFSKIWGEPAPGSFLAQLREKKEHIKGRCAKCRFLDVCGGNFRARAEAATGDVWGADPACYLTDEEIGL
jgi:12,18-didecarboxysiroheme deacetylase